MVPAPHGLEKKIKYGSLFSSVPSAGIDHPPFVAIELPAEESSPIGDCPTFRRLSYGQERYDSTYKISFLLVKNGRIAYISYHPISF